ncbi:unnamed protein product [Schistocephalus solidus]|uniref:Uncharacterized protein n=1 Tax=Schistocephalus solidus TaxID=70667 RepID=A0A183TG42_SCHSO|nr:unnamed protein product [Schistocephalus solidus]
MFLKRRRFTLLPSITESSCPMATSTPNNDATHDAHTTTPNHWRRRRRRSAFPLTCFGSRTSLPPTPLYQPPPPPPPTSGDCDCTPAAPSPLVKPTKIAARRGSCFTALPFCESSSTFSNTAAGRRGLRSWLKNLKSEDETIIYRQDSLLTGKLHALYMALCYTLTGSYPCGQSPLPRGCSLVDSTQLSPPLRNPNTPCFPPFAGRRHSNGSVIFWCREGSRCSQTPLTPPPTHICISNTFDRGDVLRDTSHAKPPPTRAVCF